MPGLEFEQQAGFPNCIVMGLDEVGRGCLAGPVMAAAVALPVSAAAWLETSWLTNVNDSKLLSEADRESLVPQIESWALAYAVAGASVEEIDRLNIYHASHLAMVRAAEQVCALLARMHSLRAAGTPPSKTVALVDGNRVPSGIPVPARAIVKGDQKCLSIACASILAKVARDRMMRELDREFPGYGFSGHKGYPTPVHRKALSELGVTGHHRRSFGPVAEALKKERECTPVSYT